MHGDTSSRMGNNDRWETDSSSGPDDAHVDDSDTQTASSQTTTADDGRLLGRRELLGSAALAGAGAVGWYVFVRNDDTSGPLDALDKSWTYWENGNAEAYKALVHSESPDRDESFWTDETYWNDFGKEDGVEWNIVERTFEERTDTRAVVEEIYFWSSPDQDPVHITDHVELRVENGDWKVWTREYISSEPVEDSN